MKTQKKAALNVQGSGLSCINRPEAELPQTPDAVMPRPLFEAFQFGESIEDGCPNVELGHLPLKRPGHHLLTQALGAIHLRLHH